MLRKTQLKRTPFKRKATKPMRRTRLHVVGHSTTSENKKEIQRLLREIVIKRDGGCFLRNFQNEITPKYINCGGLRKDGGLILQAEHLHTRSNANSFSDSRLVVCCCQRHHIYYKPQHSDEYNGLAKKFIGAERTELWDRVKNDHKPYKVDLKLEILALEQELKTYQQ